MQIKWGKAVYEPIGSVYELPLISHTVLRAKGQFRTTSTIKKIIPTPMIHSHPDCFQLM